MFHSSKKKMVFTTQVLIILVFITIMGCGHDSKSEQNIDPADVYKGKTGKAIISPVNAKHLIRWGWYGLQLGTYFHIGTQKRQDGFETMKSFQILQIVQSIKQSTMGIELSKNDSPSKAVVRQVSYVENGYSGTASFLINVNDSTGYFSGTVTYQNYNKGGNEINGIATVTGTFDFDTETPTIKALTFNTIDIYFFYNPNYNILTITGSLSWDSNIESDTDTMSINIALLDQEDGKTYWFNSYELTTIHDNDEVIQTITGRFYSHDYGYVDISTPVPITLSDRSLLFSGGSGSWVRLDLFENPSLIEADTNGDGIVDWEEEISL